MRLKSTALALALLALLPAARLMAQDPPPRHISVNTGLFQFDMAEAGYSPMIAVRAGSPISHVLLLELALLAARPDQPFGGSSTFIVPEAQVQLVLPFERFVPYMGLGAGAALDLRDSEAGGTQADFTISGSLGAKFWINEGLGIQTEFRGRGVEVDFTGTSSEYTLGLIWRI